MPHLYVATNGLSVWRSEDLGATLLRMSTGSGMYSGSQVWALAPHPKLPHELLVETLGSGMLSAPLTVLPPGRLGSRVKSGSDLQ